VVVVSPHSPAPHSLFATTHRRQERDPQSQSRSRSGTISSRTPGNAIRQADLPCLPRRCGRVADRHLEDSHFGLSLPLLRATGRHFRLESERLLPQLHALITSRGRPCSTLPCRSGSGSVNNSNHARFVRDRVPVVQHAVSFAMNREPTTNIGRPATIGGSQLRYSGLSYPIRRPARSRDRRCSA